MKIRARIQEQIEGEKVSNFLIGKQTAIKSKKHINSITVEDNISNTLIPGTKLTKKDSIEWYIQKYYENLYKSEESNEDLQKWFLQFLDEKITNQMGVILNKDINDEEIFEAVKSLNFQKITRYKWTSK